MTKQEKANEFEKRILTVSVGVTVPQITFKKAEGSTLSPEVKESLKSGTYVQVPRGGGKVKVFFQNPFDNCRLLSTRGSVQPDQVNKIGPEVRKIVREINKLWQVSKTKVLLSRVVL